MRRLILTSLVSALVAASGAAAATPRVTVISDSVLTSVTWHSKNLAILEEGFSLDMHVAVCRRLAVTSCAFEGVSPPTLFDVLAAITDLAPTVVVEMGYNDDPARFQGDVEETIARLLARGVTRIVWPTLFVSSGELARMNGVLVGAMAAHPQLTLVDWDGYARGHGDWFQTDNLHLTPAGGTGIATLIHHALAEPLAMPRQAALPAARRGAPYRASLAGAATTDGTWQLVSGALPQGLRLDASGLVSGVPLKTGSTRAGLVFRSAGAQLAYQELELRVDAPPKAARPQARKTSARPGQTRRP